MACKFNSLIETEGLFKVTGSHIHWKSGNILETVQYRDTVLRLAYPIATLSSLQSHAPIARLLKCNFSYSCAAVDKISTDMFSL